MVHEIKMMSKEEQDKVLKELNFTIDVSSEQCKADLCLPWKTLRLLRR